MVESPITTIPKVPEGSKRPLWSVMIPAYNRSQYLEKAIASVLEQYTTPEEMQIEVLDDCSTENLRAIVERAGQGVVSYHREQFNRNQPEIYNVCLRRAQGRYVHILHDDDFLLPGFYERLRRGFEAHPDIGMAFCRYQLVDSSDVPIRQSTLERNTPGILDDFIDRILPLNTVYFSVCAVRRSVYEELGGYYTGLKQTADYEMWVRIGTKKKIWFEPEVSACYRLHNGSASWQHIQTGVNISESRKTIEIISQYLPPGIVSRGCQFARVHHAMFGLHSAYDMLQERNYRAMLAQIREATKCVNGLDDARLVLKELKPYFILAIPPAIRKAIKKVITPH